MIKLSHLKTNTPLKYIFKIALSLFIVAYIFVAPTIFLPMLKHSQSLVNQKIQIDYMGILELWHIDTFEGGSKSKISFLEKQSLQFEKKHKGTFIMCYQMSVSQAKINLQNGKKPDLVSFGVGIGDKLLPLLSPLKSSYGVRDDLLNGGTNSGIIYALPFMFGGYTLITENSYQLGDKITDLLGYGGASNNSALVSLAVNNINITKISQKSDNMDSFDAYDSYLSKNFDILLGTQRDVYRVQNRIENGNMNARNFTFLSGFTDLVQYIGICSTDVIKKDICEQFVEQLLSVKTQSQLVDYNMFSTTGQKLYYSSIFLDMENALSGNLKTLNVFLTGQTISNIKTIAKNIAIESGDISQLEQYLV